MNTPSPDEYKKLAEKYFKKADRARLLANSWRRETTAMLKRARYWQQKYDESIKPK